MEESGPYIAPSAKPEMLAIAAAPGGWVVGLGCHHHNCGCTSCLCTHPFSPVRVLSTLQCPVARACTVQQCLVRHGSFLLLDTHCAHDYMDDLGTKPKGIHAQWTKWNRSIENQDGCTPPGLRDFFLEMSATVLWGTIIIHTASVLLFDSGMLWTDLDRGCRNEKKKSECPIRPTMAAGG